ncbi:MAG: tRNA pseudouridine(55) synthase TruB, partial [Lachnospiraceae bacterium]|nr:tRNA pseudouridine(55) synthase TruB [Lachnospiraceae bacterium]
PYDKTKEYVADMKLGITTDTQDISGQVIDEKEVNITIDEFKDAILSFIGASKQIPPMYSALKVDGKKLCDMARAGITVERKPRDININDIEILDIDRTSAKVRVSCSKGTYIRTLYNDIGERLGCGAVMTGLVRTRSGSFTIDKAYRLDQIEELSQKGELESIVTRVDEVFSDYAKVTVSAETEKRVLNGNQIRLDSKEEFLRVYLENGQFAAVYSFDSAKGCFVPFKMFL